MSFPHRWRAPITGAVAGLAVAAAIVGPSAIASGGRAATPRAASEDPGETAFLGAVTQLVQAGTINDAQARVLDADIHTGRIDPDQLVANGTLTTAQAQTVMDRLGAVKRSMAPAAQQSRVAKPADRKGSHG